MEIMEIEDVKTTFPPYPDYKYSGEYWMGEIPAHWEVRKLKHLFKEKRSVTNPELQCGSISFGKVVYKDDEKIPESTKASYQEVLAGEFLLNPLNLNYDLISLRIALSAINVVVSSGYIVLQNIATINKTYFNYLLHRYDVAYMKLLGSGVRQTISFTHIANSLLVAPPLHEQEKIASFLDDKTSKIDLAIAQKEKMIGLLKERKQIIIQNAVTKGLNPNAPTKHSGVEWIGEIPAHWEVKKLKFLGGIYAGINGKKGDDFSKENNGNMKPFIPFTNICNNLKIANNQYQYVKIHANENQNKVKFNDILFLMSSETLEDIAKNSIYLGTDNELYLNSFCKGYRVKSPKINPEFLNYLLFCKTYRNYFSIVGRGFTRVNLKQEFINDAYALIPPLSEQSAIVAHIEAQSAKIDKAIDLQARQIAQLKELKATLIDSAVTGKIKVS